MSSWNIDSRGGSRVGSTDQVSGGGSSQQEEFSVRVANVQWSVLREHDSFVFYSQPDGQSRGYAGVAQTHRFTRAEVARALEGQRDVIPAFIPPAILVAMMQKLNAQNRSNL